MPCLAALPLTVGLGSSAEDKVAAGEGLSDGAHRLPFGTLEEKGGPVDKRHRLTRPFDGQGVTQLTGAHEAEATDVSSEEAAA